MKKAAIVFSIALLVVSMLSCTGLVSISLPSFRTVDEERDWVTLGRNNEHQHFSPQNINPPLDVVWTRTVSSVVTDHPLAFGDYIFAPTRSGLLYLIDYETGNGLGSGRIALSLEHVPTLHDNNLYAGVTLGDKTLLGFDLEKSHKVLEERFPHVGTSPLVSEGKIYFGTDGNLFFCSDLHSGEEIWRFESNSPIHSSPSLNAENLIFADDKGWIYNLDRFSGHSQWERQLKGSTFSHPVLDDSSIYIATVTGQFYSLDQYSGSTNWNIELGGSVYSSPALFGNMLYIGTNAHEIIAVNKESGEIAWRFMTGGIVNTVPLPSPDYLYVTSWDKNLYVLNRFSGKLLFKYQLPKASKSSPIIYRDYLLIHTANHQLIALANEKLLESRRDTDEK